MCRILVLILSYIYIYVYIYILGASKNRVPLQSSILIGFSMIFHHPFLGTPIVGNTHINIVV